MKNVEIKHYKSWTSCKELKFILIPHLSINFREIPEFMRTSELYSWTGEINYSLFFISGIIFISILKK